MWDDTARWYPPLLAAGVRVERCHDLRLGHHLLRRAPAVDVRLLEGEQSEHWDRLGPSTPSDPALFSIDDTAEHLRADLEDARQLAAVAASAEAARLGLLLAAESSGALVAAEMTYAGVPWRVDVHERLLTDLLGPRPPRGARPQGLEALVAEVRGAFGAPGLNPDSRPELLAALRRAGLDVTDTRASSLRALEHPGIVPLLRYKQLAHLFQTNGWAWIDQWVSGGRFRPSYQPAGSTTGRWSSNGGGALSFPVQVRPAAVADDGWTFVVADVAQLEPRVLAGMSGDRALARRPAAPTSTRGWSTTARSPAATTPSSACSARCTAPPAARAAGWSPGSPGATPTPSASSRRRPAPVSGARWCARCSGAGRRASATRGTATPTTRRPIPTARPATGARTAASPATSSCRAPAPSGRCAGSPTCATGSGGWATPARSTARPHLVFFLHDEVVVHTPAALADEVAAQAAEAAATAAGLLFRDLTIDFPLNVSIVRSYADAGKPGVRPSRQW